MPNGITSPPTVSLCKLAVLNHVLNVPIVIDLEVLDDTLTTAPRPVVGLDLVTVAMNLVQVAVGLQVQIVANQLLNVVDLVHIPNDTSKF